MASTPPFPADLPVAPLPRLSLVKLSIGDVAESQRLLAASTQQGFFLLDLSETSEGQQLLKDADEAFEVGKRFFAEDIDTKKKFKVDSSNVGCVLFCDQPTKDNS